MNSNKRLPMAAALAAALAVAGCDFGGGKETQAEPPMPMQEFMVHVIAYNANNLWKWQGWTQGPEGESSLFPKTDEEWDMAESAGLTLAELSNLLLLPGRRLEDDKWEPYVQAMRKAAGDAAVSAEQHNPDALFEASGRLQEACAACHYHYAPHLEPPPLKLDTPPGAQNSQ